MRRLIGALGATSLVVLLLIGCGQSYMGASNSTPPAITAEPANATVTAGQSATFSVSATGTAPLGYQWQKNGATIGGATTSSYTTPATTSADNGATFVAVVSNTAGSKISSPATLTVTAAPVAPAISAQPQNQAVTVGQTATFSVAATGTAPLNYQWQKNSLNITSAMSSSYTTPATTPGDNGATFDVVITNTAGTITSSSATLTVNAAAVAPTITAQPQNQSVNAGQTATFSVTATGTAPLNYQWQKNSANISGATSPNYTTPATTSTDSGEQFRVVVANTAGNITSNQATLTVTATSGSGIDVVTHHYDNSRSGVNANETLLTPANVNAATFGKLGEFTVDGQIDGQALYLQQLLIPGQGMKNVLYVATENDSVYALDADSISGTSATVLWQTRVLLLSAGESPAPLSSMPCGNIDPNGVTATPVIDRARNAIYVEAMSQDANNHIIHRLHALNLTTGQELFGGPTTIMATYPGTGGNSQNGTVTFDPTVHHDRAALLESGGTIYMVWSGLAGDCGAYSAWVMAYSADTLAQTSRIDLVPNNYGGGMWMGGGGPAADASGDVYVASGNGFGDTPGTDSYGNSLVRLSGSGSLSVVDYFTPYNTINEDNGDQDLGSAGPLLLPDLMDANKMIRHLAVAAGKDGNLYVASRDNMGEFNALQNNIYQEFPLSPSENLSTPVYFNGTVYLCPSGQSVKAFPVTNALLATTPSTQSAHQFSNTGAVVSVSANGANDGIVWALDWGAGTLFAYDATDLTKNIYNSDQATSGRDHFAPVGGHFITPMVTNGRVYFGTASGVVVFGLLP